MPINEIEELKERLVSQLMPLRIYLFGSFANGSYTEESDFDFYIIVSDAMQNFTRFDDGSISLNPKDKKTSS